MEKAIQKFHNLQNIAKAFSNQKKICMFLRERSFQAVWNFASQPGFPKQEKDQMGFLFQKFNEEKNNSNWDSKTQIDITYFNQFLEYFYKQNSFQNATLDSLTKCLHVTEELSFFGPIDQLGIDRINYFNKKISNLQQTQRPPSLGMESQNLLGVNQPNNFTNDSNNMHNINNNNQYQAGNFNVNSYQQNQNAYNNNMNSQGMNMNMNMNNNYSCSSNSKYLDIFNVPGLPRKVDPRFQGKISKRDPIYRELKETIERYIEYANLELDYHNVNEARERLEAVAFYLSNVVE